MRGARTTSLIAVMLVVSLGAGLPASAARTGCLFGGPTPGWRAMKIELAEPTSFLTLELGGARATRPGSGEDNWHLVQGIFVVNADTLAIESYRIESAGMVARAAVVNADGIDGVRAPLPGADVPYVDAAAKVRDGLPAGNYYVVAFGSDGGRTLPNEWWSAGVQLEGSHPCTAIGVGEVFDYDQTDFTGGTHVYAPGAGYADGVELTFEATRSIVVGLMTAESVGRGVSEATLAYQAPTMSGEITERLAPLVSTNGTYSFQGSYVGFYPVLTVAGVQVDLP